MRCRLDSISKFSRFSGAKDAAFHRKPVVATENGLIGEIAAEAGLEKEWSRTKLRNTRSVTKWPRMLAMEDEESERYSVYSRKDAGVFLSVFGVQ